MLTAIHFCTRYCKHTDASLPRVQREKRLLVQFFKMCSENRARSPKSKAARKCQQLAHMFLTDADGTFDSPEQNLRILDLVYGKYKTG